MESSSIPETKATLHQIDGQLDSLIGITQEQVVGAKRVGDELDGQITMIGGINTHMDKTQTGIEGATNEVTKVKPSKGSFIAWIVAFILLVLIIVLGIWWHPKK
jgi:uncharacterized integral membrane protein